jgi:hypothetical protein
MISKPWAAPRDTLFPTISFHNLWRRALSSAVLLAAPISALAQQVWFAPNDDLARPSAPGGYLNRDFPHLFDPDPAWGAKIDAFKISPKMGSTIGPADQLTRINAFLKERRIALAVSIGAVLMDNPNPVPGECGFGVEGSNRPGRNAIQFKRLKQLGIDIEYVAMNEPLTFGHYYTKTNACRFSIDEVARGVAAAIAEIRQSYPDVRVVDEEAPPITTAAQWNADFPTWRKRTLGNDHVPTVIWAPPMLRPCADGPGSSRRPA